MSHTRFNLPPQCFNRFAITPVSLAILLSVIIGCGSRDPDSSAVDADDPAPATRMDPDVQDFSQDTPEDSLTKQTTGARNDENRNDTSPEPPAQSQHRSDPSDRKLAISQANVLRSEGRLDEAIKLLKSLLIVNPIDAEVIFRLATITSESGDLSRAVELLDEIPIDHPEAGLAAQGQSADWLMALGRFQEAESRFRTVLERVPNAAVVLRKLAFLLNRQGRRQEASELVRKLCLLGNVKQDELHSLIAITNAMHDSPETAPGKSDRVYLPISPYGHARYAFQEGKYDEVLNLLKPSIENSEAPPAMIALFGRAAGKHRMMKCSHGGSTKSHLPSLSSPITGQPWE